MRGLALALLLAPAQASAVRPRSVAIVLEGGGAEEKAVADTVARALGGRAAVSVHALSGEAAGDPIEKGRLLAALQTRDLIVPVGDHATAFVTGELENARVYFVGAAVVRGESLASPRVGGVFSYDVESLLDAARSARAGTVGLAYTPGYEPVADWVRRAAAARGTKLAERRIATLKELPAAARALFESAGSVWVLGDPLLVRGAGFEHLRERSLSRGVPLVAGSERELRRGALLAFEPSGAALADRAASDVSAALGSAERPPLGDAPFGAILLNGALAERWGVAAPRGASWRTLR